MIIEKQSYSRLIVCLFRLRQALQWLIHAKLSKPIGWLMVWAGIILLRLRKTDKGLSIFLKGRRASEVLVADRFLRHFLQSRPDAAEILLSMIPARSRTGGDQLAERFLILKMPRFHGDLVVEKGAIVIKFTETFARFFCSVDAKNLARYFRIILEPSSVGYSLPEILIWTHIAPEKVVVMAPYGPDFRLLERLQTNLLPVDLGPADWVNRENFCKLTDVEKKYDCIYVANYNPVKRVDRYVRAVVKVSRRKPDFRAALICVGVGKNLYGRQIRATIEWGRKHGNLDLLAGVKQSKLNEYLNQSKVNVLVSVREGANKGLAEGLFAGTAALLIRESACGNHLHINDQTGKVVPDRKLEEALEWFADEHGRFSPESWASEHISPESSARRLSETLQQLELLEGCEWTKDLLVKVNSPELKHLGCEYNDLRRLKGVLLSTFGRVKDSAEAGDPRFTLICKNLAANGGAAGQEFTSR